MKRTSNQPVVMDEQIQSKQQEVLSWQLLLLKATGLSLLFFLGMVVVTLLVLAGYGYSKYKSLLSATNLTHQEVSKFVRAGWDTPPTQSQGSTNFLILGMDTVPNKSFAPPLSDTIMLASIHYTTGKISLVSLPRDLWSDEYKTKINALYFYGLERYPDNPEQFSTEVISEMTGIPLHHTLVLTLQSVAELIDAVGGIQVDVPIGFTDTEFPRSDVDVTVVKDPLLLYETIEFAQGPQLMNGDTALKYIRSRHSSGDTGTDTDRGIRQQLVIDSLIHKLKNKDFLLNQQNIANLYEWYSRYVKKTLPESYLVSMAKALFPVRNTINLQASSLSIFPAQPNGVLHHPPVKETQNQWSYTIRNQQLFQQEIKEKLAL